MLTPPPPDPDCLAISKSASPATDSTVEPGELIQYTIAYTVSNASRCQNSQAKLIDSLPVDTIFVSGSASDGITPNPDGALVWDVALSASSGTKMFSVLISETQCQNQGAVYNRAALLMGGRPPLLSNETSHAVLCGWPFAVEEIQVDPYPPIAGIRSRVSVRIKNLSTIPEPVTVSFQTSPNVFGIGLESLEFAAKALIIPANGSAIVTADLMPAVSGHFCLFIVLQSPRYGYDPHGPYQRNIDVVEDLRPGITDTLTFKVRNPTSNTADIRLVVAANTCPGWTAIVTPTKLLAMAPGEVREAQLQVTPLAPLGTECHVVVIGWIGNRLIGYIEKVDLPLVQLPVELRDQIVFIPDPQVISRTNEICVKLQNPMPVSRTVTVTFDITGFGAGLPWTTVATETYHLPPNSMDLYCTAWHPTSSGHGCARVTLKQPGYLDQVRQQNFEVIRTSPDGPPCFMVSIGNPDGVLHTLLLKPVIYGIDPYWQLRIVDVLGNPPPETLRPYQIIELHLCFAPAGTLASGRPATPPEKYKFGDESLVDVDVLLDGASVGSFSVELQPLHIYFLPISMKH
ncbi:MAG: hypothetical protein CVU38_08460 [Chloroflexi bacterium HGW-Chloroflexi-1]|nr:MAG: hypothetical protein CVU38_08460 [Chloroflexi bacterium HGW-Chloroflexi-1]